MISRDRREKRNDPIIDRMITMPMMVRGESSGISLIKGMKGRKVYPARMKKRAMMTTAATRFRIRTFLRISRTTGILLSSGITIPHNFKSAGGRCQRSIEYSGHAANIRKYASNLPHNAVMDVRQSNANRELCKILSKSDSSHLCTADQRKPRREKSSPPPGT